MFAVLKQRIKSFLRRLSQYPIPKHDHVSDTPAEKLKRDKLEAFITSYYWSNYDQLFEDDDDKPSREDR